MATRRALACLLLAALAPAAANLGELADATCANGQGEADAVNLLQTPSTRGPALLASAWPHRGWRFVPPIRREVLANGKKQPGFVLELTHHCSKQTILFESIAGAAGQIVSLKLNGDNLLLETPSGYGKVWGSTFWPSPQSTWGWPPLPAFLTAVFDAEVDEEAMSVTLRGPISEKLGVRVVKKFTADLAKGGIDVEYTMETNESTKTRLAPWEITRLKPEGLLVWQTAVEEEPTLAQPAGGAVAHVRLDRPREFDGAQARLDRPRDFNTSLLGLDAFPPLPIHKEFGHSWYDLGAGTGEGQGKSMVPGGGDWMAYVKPGVLCIKRFDHIAPSEAAPEESQIEIYTNAEKGGAEHLHGDGDPGRVPGALVRESLPVDREVDPEGPAEGDRRQHSQRGAAQLHPRAAVSLARPASPRPGFCRAAGV
eukprot:CAMPEP_0195085056 /NCGR_PEP_ID=MMETSP0448-20130528/25567_1 /TAXON_ID=66468 /ORGANISM="Heterocapsa triquestra, Strain CCMP 448" /LENGTH=424 /DNA_ID=CAMNT_0040118433 /DNA_START=90 /DNA_END=1359 /DNA_ORIENTATION=+